MLVDGCNGLLFRDAELFHELIKGWPTNPQINGCGSDSTGMSLQRLLDHFAFHLLARLSESGCGRASDILIPIQLEILRGYSRSARHNDTTFHAILELADISRPGMMSHCTQRVRREHQLRAPLLSGIALQELTR